MGEIQNLCSLPLQNQQTAAKQPHLFHQKSPGYLAFQGGSPHTLPTVCRLQLMLIIINNSVFIFHSFKRNICVWGRKAPSCPWACTTAAGWCRLSSSCSCSPVQVLEPGAARGWLISVALLQALTDLSCSAQLSPPQTMLLFSDCRQSGLHTDLFHSALSQFLAT